MATTRILAAVTLIALVAAIIVLIVDPALAQAIATAVVHYCEARPVRLLVQDL